MNFSHRSPCQGDGDSVHLLITRKMRYTSFGIKPHTLGRQPLQGTVKRVPGQVGPGVIRRVTISEVVKHSADTGAENKEYKIE